MGPLHSALEEENMKKDTGKCLRNKKVFMPKRYYWNIMLPIEVEMRNL
jgi:hypothetical protein